MEIIEKWLQITKLFISFDSFSLCTKLHKALTFHLDQIQTLVLKGKVNQLVFSILAKITTILNC